MPLSTPELTMKQVWKAFGAICLGFFMLLVDSTVVSVATPVLEREIDASLNQVLWVTSIYLVTFAVPILVTGRLGDRYSQKNIYLVGLVVFTISSLACGLSHNVFWIIIWRAVQGFGASCMTPQTMSIINRIVPRKRFGAVMGVWGAVAGIATLVGPILGGFLISIAGWEWIFFINVPVGILGMVAVYYWVPTIEQAVRSIHLSSVAVSMFSIFGLVFGLQQGTKLGWSPAILALLVASILGVAIFVKQQDHATRRGKDPLVPLILFKDKNFSLGSYAIATLGFVVTSYIFPVMQYLQVEHKLSAEQAGLVLAPMAVISLGVSPISGRLADKINPKTLAVTGFSLMSLAIIVGALVMRNGFSLAWVFLPICLMGAGNGCVWSATSTASLRSLDLELAGSASGVYNTTRQIGSVLGTAAISAVMQAGLLYVNYADAMGYSIIMPAVVAISGIIAVSKFTTTANLSASKTDTALAGHKPDEEIITVGAE